MDILVLDSLFTPIIVLDMFESIIWTDRYYGFGDFEICTPVIDTILQNVRQNCYFVIEESMCTMIVESIQIKSDVENGNQLLITGRSIESILNRRIVWDQTVISGNLQDGIHQLLLDNVIDPTIADRKINNFIFEASIDPAITSLTIEAQFVGDNLYDALQSICEPLDISFRIILDNDTLRFILFSGIDRSYDQIDTPYVIFSPKFENLLNSNYLESEKNLKTVSLVSGEGVGLDKKTIIVGSGTGISRREMFINASSISQNVDGVLIPDLEYYDQLSQYGLQELSKNISINSFEGQVDSSTMFKYGEDFFIGDIIQIVNEYGFEAKARITELIISQSESGIDIHPTFSTIV